MLDELQPAIRFAIMSILCTIYESGLVEVVDMADVMRLFGVRSPASVDTAFSFDDQGWIEAYIDFRENAGEELIAYALDMDELELEETGPVDLDLDLNRKLH